MTLIADAFNVAEELLGKVPTSVVAEIGGTSVTWSALEASSMSLSAVWVAFTAAVRAKNYGSVAEITLEEAATIVSDLGIGEPFSSLLAKVFLPLLFEVINNPDMFKAMFSGPIPEVTKNMEVTIFARFDAQGDVFKMTPQSPAPAPTAPAAPADEPDMPSGMRPSEAGE